MSRLPDREMLLQPKTSRISLEDPFNGSPSRQHICSLSDRNRIPIVSVVLVRCRNAGVSRPGVGTHLRIPYHRRIGVRLTGQQNSWQAAGDPREWLAGAADRRFAQEPAPVDISP